MEFLLIVVKMFLIENSPDTKIILMSATFDTDEFASYFCQKKYGKLCHAPTINILVKRQHKIYEFFLDDLQSLPTQEKIDYDTPSIQPLTCNIVVLLVKLFANWDEDLGKDCPDPTVLIFLPGIYEIQEMHRRLVQEMHSRSVSLIIYLPFHARSIFCV